MTLPMLLLSLARLVRGAPLAALAPLSLVVACSGSTDIARDDPGNGQFVVGSACDPNAFPDCGFTDLDCDARTKKCVVSNGCSSDTDCSDLFACRTGVKSCSVACFGDDNCKKGARCDETSHVCVAATTTSSDRSCPPNCTVGHQCCAGSCAGSAVAMPNDCCSCLTGEVSSAPCGGHCAG